MGSPSPVLSLPAPGTALKGQTSPHPPSGLAPRQSVVSAPHFPALPESRGAGRGPAGTRTLPAPCPAQRCRSRRRRGSRRGAASPAPAAPHTPPGGGTLGAATGSPPRRLWWPREGTATHGGTSCSPNLAGGHSPTTWGSPTIVGDTAWGERRTPTTWGGSDLAQGGRGSPTHPHGCLNVGHPHSPGVRRVRGAPRKPRGTLLEPERGHALGEHP